MCPRYTSRMSVFLLILLASLMGWVAPAWGDFQPGQVETRTLIWDGIERSYEVYRPVGTVAPEGLPVVLDFHGYTSTSAQQRSISGIQQLADNEIYLGVWPQGSGSVPSWNGGILCCGEAYSQQVDDVGFVRALVNALAEETQIDSARIYATGLSNDGAITHRLACEAADLFAAAAPAGFPIPMLPLSSCQPSRPIAVGMVMGLTDVLVPYSGWIGNAQDTLAQWRNVNGCGSGEPDEVIALSGAGTCEIYTSCSEGVTTRLCSIVGLDFTGIPSLEPYSGHLLYLNSSGFDVALESWNFMSSFVHPNPPILPVPEPSEGVLLFAGLTALWGMERGRRRSAG